MPWVSYIETRGSCFVRLWAQNRRKNDALALSAPWHGQESRPPSVSWKGTRDRPYRRRAGPDHEDRNRPGITSDYLADDGVGHVRGDLGRRERAVVDAHFVDHAVEELARGRVVAADTDCAVGDVDPARAGHGLGEHAVDVEPHVGAVIRHRDMAPRVERQRRVATRRAVGRRGDRVDADVAGGDRLLTRERGAVMRIQRISEQARAG